MINSILLSTKDKLGLAEDYTVFDNQVIDYINAALATVTDLGIGPPSGYAIVDENDEWDDLLVGDKRLNPVKSYIFLRTRLLFDPPTTSYAVEAFERQVKEAEWRLNVKREEETWVPPTPDEEL